jgi:hypothetical protein
MLAVQPRMACSLRSSALTSPVLELQMCTSMSSSFYTFLVIVL